MTDTDMDFYFELRLELIRRPNARIFQRHDGRMLVIHVQERIGDKVFELAYPVSEEMRMDPGAPKAIARKMTCDYLHRTAMARMTVGMSNVGKSLRGVGKPITDAAAALRMASHASLLNAAPGTMRRFGVAARWYEE